MARWRDDEIERFEGELARVAERESTVRAWVTRHPDETLRAAVASAPDGPLRGWTLGVKDVIDTADLATERGSAIYAGRTTAHDASCVALARAAGAVVTGKTVTTEFALIAPGVTTNPHDPSRTPGGSSSGSAAAVADGHVRAAFGTQTVGSVIRPAAFCGVVGFKPTYGLVPTTGVASLAPSYDTVGWMTRSVADAATLLATLASPAGRASPAEPSGRVTTPRPRVGVYRSPFWSKAQPETAEVISRAADDLADAGFDVVTLGALDEHADVFEITATVLSAEIARVFAWERTHHPDLIASATRKMFEAADGIEPAQAAEAQRQLARMRLAHDELLTREGLDALLTPSAPGEAPSIETTGDSIFNRIWTSLGVPAINLPAGRGPTGLPVGLQLAGRAWHDLDLLALAARVEPIVGP